MEIRVNPTRMELNRLKKRLNMAGRGHKLLKDKRDELVRQFLILVRQNRELRERVEKELSAAFASFMLARAGMPIEALEEALMYPTRRLELQVSKKNIMSVYTPQFQWEEQKKRGRGQYLSLRICGYLSRTRYGYRNPGRDHGSVAGAG